MGNVNVGGNILQNGKNIANRDASNLETNDINAWVNKLGINNKEDKTSLLGIMQISSLWVNSSPTSNMSSGTKINHN